MPSPVTCSKEHPLNAHSFPHEGDEGKRRDTGDGGTSLLLVCSGTWCRSPSKITADFFNNTLQMHYTTRKDGVGCWVSARCFLAESSYSVGREQRRGIPLCHLGMDSSGGISGESVHQALAAESEGFFFFFVCFKKAWELCLYSQLIDDILGL